MGKPMLILPDNVCARAAVKSNPVGWHFNRAEWFALPLTFRRRWWRETDYSTQPASDRLLADLHVLLARGPLQPPTVDDLQGLKAAMASAHPDRGGSSAAFIAARAKYVAARRSQRAGGVSQC
jgi:hypothetical protein